MLTGAYDMTELDISRNIFTYATKELSQDAVICWILNEYNFPESSLYPLAVEFLKKLADFNPEEDGNQVVIKKQLFKIDILVYFPKSGRAIIIEDKVYGSERWNQINEYKKRLVDCSRNVEEKKSIGLDYLDESKMSTVYLKTGFMYYIDRLVKADVKIGGQAFLELLNKYQDKDVLLDRYIEYLENLLDWYEDHKNFADLKNLENFKSWDISKEQFTQYQLMKHLFDPADDSRNRKWDGESDKDSETGCYYIYHGSSWGKPWTQMIVKIKPFSSGRGNYKVFWRIDTDSKGPYLSLRFYDDYNKNDEEEKKEHIEMYGKECSKLETVLGKIKKNLSRPELYTISQAGEKNNEVKLLHIGLVDILKNWNDCGDKFVKDVNMITDEFMQSEVNL